MFSDDDRSLVEIFVRFWVFHLGSTALLNRIVGSTFFMIAQLLFKFDSLENESLHCGSQRMPGGSCRWNACSVRIALAFGLGRTLSIFQALATCRWP